MRRKLLAVTIVLLFTSSYNLFAQKKDFSYAQLFQSAPTDISKSLPSVGKWVDDEHYLENRKDESDGKMKLMSVDVKTGKAVPYESKFSDESSTVSEVDFPKDAKNVTYSPDKKYAAFTVKNNLFVREGSSGKTIQITTDGNDSIMNGYSSWVYFEEILGRPTRYRAFWWAPDSKHIVFMRFDDSPVPVFPIYVANGQHGYLEKQRYPKPGDNNPYVRIGVTSVDNPAVTWADFNEKDDQYFGTPYWSPSGKLLVQWMNRDQNNLKIYEINLSNGSKKEVYDEQQKTWIDLDEDKRIEFLSAGKGWIIMSDKDGWQNLYLYDDNGKFISQLTSGNFWGTTILKIDEKSKTVFFRARKENSARFDLYKVGLDGKNLARLTFGDYSHDQISLSPNEKYFITTYSNLSTPYKMALVDMKGKVIRELGDIKGTAFDNYNLAKTELKFAKSADGKFDLPVQITYPTNFDPNKKYPVLISIYGGPNAGTVYDRWKPVGGVTQWWAQEGLIQVAFDNRSSGHFGKNGLNYIYRVLGKYEIEDYMSCAKWLKQQSFIDSNKICITGGSFGGYMTCMALTYGADVFPYGIANSSVTDWSLYDTHYTERFMDKPQDNPDGYRMTSVLTYTDRYKGLLRIIHGTSDDNVHMQNSLQLINKLEDSKKHFELMMYPGERHGIGGMKGQHNRLEAYQFIYDNLLNKRMPAVFWGNGGQQRGF
ncbi:MAG TPA: DPP IV N-terminal domain-containing protein [Chitinophagaceae bacterium]|nr:DPP IV N-terminal domain-containing protein [Chitinophagaceae bacterium]